MVVTKDVELPSIESLNVEEVNVSHVTLVAAAPYIGKSCEAVNNEFMLCRCELEDPRACIELGKRVTSCTLQLLKNIKKNCLHEFNQYSKCVEKSSGDYSYLPCRNTQAVFDTCMNDKMNMSRPQFGYFCRARLHTSSSTPPPPPPCPCHPSTEDAVPKLPDDCPRKPARFGSRIYFTME